MHCSYFNAEIAALRKSKIDELDLRRSAGRHIARQTHDIFRLEVEMRDLELVHVRNRLEHLLDYPGSFVFGQLLALGEIVKELTAAHEFKDEDNFIGSVP